MTTTRQLNAEALVKKLMKAYPSMTILEVTPSRVEIITEESPKDRTGLSIFDYWVEDYREKNYIFGVRTHLHEFLSRNGWYAEWVNSYTIALYKG